jgi:hypothetical protein
MATPDKPEVVHIAGALGIDQDAVTGKLIRLWMWADQQSLDGCGLCVTEAFIDRLVFCAGFADAMRNVGWILGRDGLLEFPNFSRHNGQTAKQRSESARRMAKSRQANKGLNADVAEKPQQKPQLEKRREEKSSLSKLKEGGYSPIGEADEADGLKLDPEKPSSKPVAFEKGLLTLWNSQLGFQQCRTISSGRMTALRARLREPWWRDHWEEGIKVASRSAFLTGRKASGDRTPFRANMDWFLRPDTLTKIIEGNYTDDDNNTERQYQDGKF